jgi:acyl-CoA synthetase (AMP-forming)/AMP-acid ligase II
VAFSWDPVPPEASRAAGYVRAGWWNDESLGELLGAGLNDAAAQPFTVRSDRRPFRGTLADVDAMARRIAGGLRARGIGAGSIVAFQLPNWVEAAATFYATCYLGATVVPVVHFYGTKELGYILRRTGVQGLVTTDAFGAQHFLDNLATLRAEPGGLPALEWVAVVGERSFDELLDAPPVDGPVPTDPAAPALIAYTSGTTSDPKGVVHAHRTIGAEIRQLGEIQSTAAEPGAAPAPDMLTGAPVGHGIGMLAALLLPVWRRRAIHLIDVWDPARVLAAMRDDGLSAGQGATVFLTSLLDHPDFDLAVHGPLMATIGLGGAAVPVAVCERARSLGIECSRSYGCTEHPSMTGSQFDDPWQQRCTTDGKPLPGVEMRLVDASGHDAGTGEPGEIWSRGPDCFWGYTDPARTAEAFVDGWYRTGDVGVLDAHGRLTITDRLKDIIIRGGENVSAQEVEELLMRMRGVAECAVVAAPDERLGEHAAAFLRMQTGTSLPSIDAMRAHLSAAGLAKQKWPEELHAAADFPRTASGKIQKFVLRQRLRDAVAQ